MRIELLIFSKEYEYTYWMYIYTCMHVLQLFGESALNDYIGIWSLRESNFNWKVYRSYVKNNSILSPPLFPFACSDERQTLISKTNKTLLTGNEL